MLLNNKRLIQEYSNEEIEKRIRPKINSSHQVMKLVPPPFYRNFSILFPIQVIIGEDVHYDYSAHFDRVKRKPIVLSDITTMENFIQMIPHYNQVVYTSLTFGVVVNFITSLENFLMVQKKEFLQAAINNLFGSLNALLNQLRGENKKDILLLIKNYKSKIFSQVPFDSILLKILRFSLFIELQNETLKKMFFEFFHAYNKAAPSLKRSYSISDIIVRYLQNGVTFKNNMEYILCDFTFQKQHIRFEDINIKQLEELTELIIFSLSNNTLISKQELLHLLITRIYNLYKCTDNILRINSFLTNLLKCLNIVLAYDENERSNILSPIIIEIYKLCTNMTRSEEYMKSEDLVINYVSNQYLTTQTIDLINIILDCMIEETHTRDLVCVESKMKKFLLLLIKVQQTKMNNLTTLKLITKFLNCINLVLYPSLPLANQSIYLSLIAIIADKLIHTEVFTISETQEKIESTSLITQLFFNTLTNCDFITYANTVLLDINLKISLSLLHFVNDHFARFPLSFYLTLSTFYTNLFDTNKISTNIFPPHTPYHSGIRNQLLSISKYINLKNEIPHPSYVKIEFKVKSQFEKLIKILLL